MKLNAAVLLLTAVIVICLGECYANSSFDVHRRFEYKLSFKGPHLTQRDGSVPFWVHGGSAIASDESIRITPSLRSKKGYVWSQERNTADHWEVQVEFSISGRGRIGADGLAIWYTEAPGKEGPVFGSNDKWTGLGVFFDSFDNDNRHNNPFILGMVNDGTKAYDHKTDGSSQQLAGCLRDFRNKPFKVHAKIEYYKKALTVFFHNGMTDSADKQYELCFRADNVELPREGYFGVSAATGGLADDHDVSSFITHSLRPLDKKESGQEVPEGDRQKYEKEFEEYYEKLQKAKDEYRKEHPDAGNKFDYEYEGQETRELKQIFDAQDAIHSVLRNLNEKVDAIIGRQERTLAQLSSISSGGTVGSPSGGAPPSGVSKYDIDEILRVQRSVSDSVKTIHNRVNELKLSSGGAGGSQYDSTGHFNEIKNHMNNLQRDIKSFADSSKQNTNFKCPEVANISCVSTTMLIFMTLLQISIFIGYSMYRSSKDAQAKKFY